MKPLITPEYARLTRIILGLLRLALIIAGILSIAAGNWTVLFASAGTLVLTFLPQIIANQVNVRLPLQFELIITVFLYASLFLGEVGGYYGRFGWWDIMLHAWSSFAFGFAGFLVLFLLHARGKLKAGPGLIAVFAFTFGLAIGAIWEIYEFSMDQLLGTNMQKSGLTDTMGDLVVDTLGAGIASAIGYIYLRHKIWDPFDALIRWFLEANPRFQRKSRIVERNRS
jgi:hypothetical protein